MLSVLSGLPCWEDRVGNRGCRRQQQPGPRGRDGWYWRPRRTRRLVACNAQGTAVAICACWQRTGACAVDQQAETLIPDGAQGWQHICLLARTGHAAAPAGSPLRAALTSAAMVTVTRCDAADRGEVVSFLTEHGASGKRMPLRAVMHCGGVLRDAALQRQTLASLRQVASPKAAAGTLWHRLLLAYPTAQQVRSAMKNTSTGGCLCLYARCCLCANSPPKADSDDTLARESV